MGDVIVVCRVANTAVSGVVIVVMFFGGLYMTAVLWCYVSALSKIQNKLFFNQDYCYLKKVHHLDNMIHDKKKS